MKKQHIFGQIILSLTVVAAVAEPSPTTASIWLVQFGPSGITGLEYPYAQHNIQPNTQVTLMPDRPDWGPLVIVSYNFETIGQQRHVTVSMETENSASFFNQTLIDSFEPDDDVHRYQTEFAIGPFSDPDWNGDNSTIQESYSLYGDGVTILSYSLPGSETVFANNVHYAYPTPSSPTLPGAFGSDVIADRFVLELTYYIPEPGTLALLISGLLLIHLRR